jgi:F420-non-reducing hydrogenase iron-sulfur subunit
MDGESKKMANQFKPELTIFHCINTFPDSAALPLAESEDFSIKSIKLPCSSMVKDVYLLRAFEAGADAVLVFVCPQGQCRYVEGNIRADKRVQFVKKLLDEIEIDGRRLALFNIAAGDTAAAVAIIQKALSELMKLGPNPAA